ncbi:MAG: response regulator transcription factor [Saprospiraceae bacterium]|nr:response regulator transcription factor [Saprospiraceae bacterium]
MNIIRVVIVEDDTVIRSSMQELLSFVEDLHCIGVYEKAEEFMRNFKDIKPDVVLMDITLPGMNGIQCVRETKPLRPVVQYLMCTSHSDAERTFDSLCAGATGYILKNSTPDQISTAIRDIHNGGSPMSAEIARLVVNSFPKNSWIQACWRLSLRANKKYCMHLLKVMLIKKLLINYLSA